MEPPPEEADSGYDKIKLPPRGQYTMPPLDLLTKANRLGEQQQLKGIRDRARLLENTLSSFGVKARVVHVQTGPTVTRFEVQPEAGVKVSKIVSLADDLALNLAAPWSGSKRRYLEKRPWASRFPIRSYPWFT